MHAVQINRKPVMGVRWKFIIGDQMCVPIDDRILINMYIVKAGDRGISMRPSRICLMRGMK